jgi:hypothetical protein
VDICGVVVDDDAKKLFELLFKVVVHKQFGSNDDE